MTIPSPGFTSANVETEIGASSFTSATAAVLALVGHGAPYGSSDLAGKSAYTPMVATATGGGDAEGPGTGTVFGLAVSVTGGNPSKTYNWIIQSTPAGTAEIISGQGTPECNLDVIAPGGGDTAIAIIYCAVSDGTATVNSNTQTCQYVDDGGGS